MATYTPIEHGKANWDKDLNDNLAKIFGGGATDDSGWVDCATLVNDAQIYSALSSNNTEDRSTAIKRRVLNFGKFKLIFIAGAVGYKFTEDNFRGLTVAQLPAGFPVSYRLTDGWLLAGSVHTTVRWYVAQDGRNLLIDGVGFDPVPKVGDLLWFPINLMYISD